MTGDRRRGRRGLTEDERRLWQDVTRSVAPLRRARKAAKPSEPPSSEAAVEKSARARSSASPTPPRAPAAEKPQPALVPLGPRVRRKIARGRETIDARIDLHGMTQAEAHAKLAHFLRRAQANDARIVLVITGKGKRGDDGERERGVLRRQVPQWLRLPELRAIVIGFEEAAIGHGGEGALYVRIRRGAPSGP